MSSKDICKQLDELKQNETCKPELQYDFKSMNVEVSLAEVMFRITIISILLVIKNMIGMV